MHISATSEGANRLLPQFDQREIGHSQGIFGLARFVMRRMNWIIGSILVCELLAIFVTIRTKPVYESTATIELNQGGGSMDLGVDALLSQQLSGGAASLEVDQQTEIAILRDDSLALAVIEHLGLASQPPFARKDEEHPTTGSSLEQSSATRTRLLQIFKDNLNVTPIRGTRLIQIAYQSHSPMQAAQIANAIVDNYRDQYLQSHYEATSEASDWLAKQLLELKSNVEESEKKLTTFEKETGILSMNFSPSGSTDGAETGQIHSVVIEKLDALNSELTASEANRIEKEAIYRLVKSNNQDVILGLGNDPLAVQSNSMVLTEGGGLSNLERLRQQQNELKISLAQAATIYGAKNRHLKELQTQMLALDEQVQQEMRQLVQRAQADYQLAKETEDALRQQFVQQQEAASKLNEKTVQFSVLSQEAYSSKKLYEDLYTKLQEANISAGIKATNITIIDPARPQSIPVLPKRGYNLSLGLLVGVFLGFVTGYAAEGLDRTVSNPLDVEEITGAPVIGVIPNFGSKNPSYGARLATEARKLKGKGTINEQEESEFPRSVWLLDHPESAGAEAVRALRTSILLSRAGSGSKCIVVTSCSPGEGKTTITLNLAVALAQHGAHVIVIEADMRRPGMRRLATLPKEIGLSNVLTGSCTTEKAIHRELFVPNLDILPAGPRPPLPADILGSPAFDELLKDLRSHYGIVLIDSPPALLVTDAVLISLQADAVIWVAQSEVVSRPQLSRANRLIERNRMPVIGFVMNRMRKGIGRYEYGYQYDFDHTYYGEDISNGA